MNIKPISNYLVSVENRYIEEVVTNSGIKLFVDPSFNPAMHVSVVGRIVALPIDNILNLSVGTEVFFSYVVIGQRDYVNTGDVFHSLFDRYNDDFQRFMNGRGESITIVSFPGVISKIYAGTHLDNRGRMIGDGVQGTFSQMERWKSKFTFDSGGGYKYKNLLHIDGQEVWSCKPEYIFCIKKGNKLLPVSDRLILKPVKVEVPKEVLSEMMVRIPESTVFTRYSDRGELSHFDKQTGLKKGDIIGFDSKYVERYEVDGKEHFLIKRRRILGTYKKVS